MLDCVGGGVGAGVAMQFKTCLHALRVQKNLSGAPRTSYQNPKPLNPEP